MPFADHDLPETQALYKKLSQNPDLDGTFSLDGYSIQWHRNCTPYLRITWDTIEFIVGNTCPFHWHPNYDENELEDFYQELVKIGKKGNILVVRDAYLSQHILFVGSAKEYFSQKRICKKWGKKYIFGDTTITGAAHEP